MSSVVTYEVEGLTLDVGVFNLFEETSSDRNEIEKLSELSEDVMTVTQNKRLIALREGRKVSLYNNIKISTLDHRDADIYYNKSYKTLSIPGHEGNNLTFKLSKDKKSYVINNAYFDDNYDAHLDIVQKVIRAFRGNCTIKYVSDEMDSGEDVPDTIYKDGITRG